MKYKYTVTFFKWNKPKSYCVCSRNLSSTKKFAWRQLFKDSIYWFTIKPYKKR